MGDGTLPGRIDGDLQVGVGGEAEASRPRVERRRRGGEVVSAPCAANARGQARLGDVLPATAERVEADARHVRIAARPREAPRRRLRVVVLAGEGTGPSRGLPWVRAKAAGIARSYGR